MKCIICNTEIEKSRYSNADLCSSKCFHIDLWNKRLKERDNPRIARINGEQYYIDNEKKNKSYCGFGGREYKIKFFDGREVTTTNLWYNGIIPETHKELLPNNAEFIVEEPIYKII